MRCADQNGWLGIGGHRITVRQMLNVSLFSSRSFVDPCRLMDRRIRKGPILQPRAYSAIRRLSTTKKLVTPHQEDPPAVMHSFLSTESHARCNLHTAYCKFTPLSAFDYYYQQYKRWSKDYIIHIASLNLAALATLKFSTNHREYLGS